MTDRIIFVGILVLAGVYFWATSQIPTLEIGDPLGPKAFPRLLGIGLLVSAAMLLAEMLKERKIPASAQEPATSNDGSTYKVVAGVVVVTGIYFMLFEKLGYAVSTSLFMLVMTSYFNKGRWLMNVLTSVLVSFISYYAFAKWLGVNLPAGVLAIF